MGTIGLYHPFIHFRQDGWLKLSALYWDKMARLVPASYALSPGQVALERDSDLTRELIDTLGFVVNVPPQEATYPLSECFGELLMRHAEALRARYGLDRADQWPEDPITARYAQLRNPRLAYVHSEKLHSTLVEALEAEGLASAHFDGEGHWMGMHPKLARVYMAALAEETALTNALHPVCDDAFDHASAAGWSLPRLAAVLLDAPTLARDAVAAADEGPEEAYHEELRAGLALVALETVIPKDPDALDVATIAALRDEFGPERFRFQELAAELARDLPALGPGADPAAVRAHLESACEAKIRPLVKNLRAALNGRGVDTAQAALGTTIAMPPGLSQIPLDNPVSFGVAAVLSLLPVVRAKHRQAREVYARCPAAYLYRIEEAARPQSLLAKMGAGVRRFLVGL